MKQRIIPFVDHEIGYRLLRRLIDFSNFGSIEIPLVVTTRENQNAWWPSVVELCDSEGISLLIYEDVSYEALLGKEIDWLFLLSWKYIIPHEIIALPKYAVLNLHYSLLPKFRGVYPVNWAIIKGMRSAGFTYHVVNDKIDGGKIVMQEEVPVYLSDTARTLQLRIDDAVYIHFDELMNAILIPNVESFLAGLKFDSSSDASYHSKIEFEQACEIDLNQNYKGLDFYNLLRGLNFRLESKNAYIIDATTGKRIYINLTLDEE